jgi:hypothetical protein
MRAAMPAAERASVIGAGFGVFASRSIRVVAQAERSASIEAAAALRKI